jgi:hypothetical protein
MTAGPPAGSLDSRALARWWGQLAPLHPRALWVGHLDLTHLDALVRVARPQPLDPLHRLLLRAVETPSPTTLDQLDTRLGLGPAPLFQWLRDLDAAGLVRRAEAIYTLTAAGTEAIATGTYARPDRERRRFTFVDVPGGAPHFLLWRPRPGPAGPASGVDVRLLAECVDRPADWKRTYGFPTDVTGVEIADPTLPAAEAWRRVVVVRTERVPVALAVVGPADGPERLVGFVVVNDALAATEPAVELDAGWQAPFPELAADPAPGPEASDGWRLVGEGRLRRAVEVRGGD